MPVKDGEQPLRAHLEQREKQTGFHDPRLDSVQIPDGFMYLWNIFWELYRGCANGFSGKSITWGDVQAYQGVSGFAFDAFELEAIFQMDAARAEGVKSLA